MQDEIAKAIVQALQIRMMGGSLSRREGGTENLEAYQLYLRSRSANLQNTKSSLEDAAAYLERAIEVDPNYGMAWASLAENFANRADNGFLDATEGYEKSRQLANQALQLSPDSAYAHTRLQYVYLNFDWDWAAADAEGRRARAISATDPEVLNQAGMLSYVLGHWDDAERQFQELLVRDPLSSYTLWNLGFTYYAAGRFVESEAVLERFHRRSFFLAPRDSCRGAHVVPPFESPYRIGIWWDWPPSPSMVPMGPAGVGIARGIATECPVRFDLRLGEQAILFEVRFQMHPTEFSAEFRDPCQ